MGHLTFVDLALDSRKIRPKAHSGGKSAIERAFSEFDIWLSGLTKFNDNDVHDAIELFTKAILSPLSIVLLQTSPNL